MLTLIKNIEVFAPERLGKKDVLIAGNTIESIQDCISLEYGGAVKVIDGSGKMLTPGFIDPHVHILGGGGEGSYKTRTPELLLSEVVSAGVTTVGGLLGTDGITRNMASLLAKARGLEEEGITTVIFSGNYRLPITPLTNGIMEDIVLIDKIIGAGEVAISDHRSSQPTEEELTRLAADARVGGMLSGKAGIVQIHLGDGKSKLDMLFNILEKTEIPVTQFYPTHMSRSPELLEEGIKFAKMGGRIDLSATQNPEFWEKQYGEIRVSKSYKHCLDSGVSENNITISSDGHGSLPMFNDKMEYVGMEVAVISTPLDEVRDAVQSLGIPIEKIIKTVTSNVADVLCLPKKGRIREGYDADLCIMTQDSIEVLTVIAKGKILMEDGKVLVKGTFEK